VQNSDLPEPQVVIDEEGPLRPGIVFHQGAVTIGPPTVTGRGEHPVNLRAQLDATVDTTAVEVILSPIFEKALDKPEWPKKYHLEIVGSGPGEVIEAILVNDRGEVTFHDLDHSDFTPHWASVELIDKAAEALIRAIEGLDEDDE
jgi:hypothetical protein